MTHPSIHARTYPNKDRLSDGGDRQGDHLSRNSTSLSNQGAQPIRSLGLKAGDHIALLMDKPLAFMEICWAVQRAGLYYTATAAT